MLQLKKQLGGKEQKKGTKRRKWDSGYTAERQVLERTRATIKLSLEQRTFGLQEEIWSSKKTGKKLYAICSQSTKKSLKLHKGLCKATSALILQIRIEKISLKKFLHFRKIPGFDLLDCLCWREIQSAKHMLMQCQVHIKKRNRTWEEDKRKAAFGRISWKEMLTQPKFAKIAMQFIKLLGLID